MGLFSMSVGDFEDMYAYFDDLPTPFMEMTKVRESQRVQKARAKPCLHEVKVFFVSRPKPCLHEVKVLCVFWSPDLNLACMR